VIEGIKSHEDWSNDATIWNSAKAITRIVGMSAFTVVSDYENFTIWDCRIDDFMCPRYEWDKKHIPLKGIGSCERGAAPRMSTPGSMFSTAILVGLTAVFVAGMFS